MVLVSGGVDSAVTAAIAAREGEVALLHANYGQKTEAREFDSFNSIAGHYGAQKRLVVRLDHFKDIGGSALIDHDIEVPEGDIGRGDIPMTYVPFRNAHLLCVAVSWAETIGAGRVYIGAVEEDSSGYPDCREGFFKAFEGAIEQGTRPETKIEVVTPLIHMSKGDIVRKGVELGAPFHLTWSCYKDSRRACGRCDSCLLRLKGFKEAGVEDPIPYE